MSFKIIEYVPAVLISAAAIALSSSPVAVAEPGVCRTADTVTVCEETGSAGVAAQPAIEGAPDGAGAQNGPYGPAGATPPVGN